MSVPLTPAVLLLLLRAICAAVFLLEHVRLARRAWRARAFLSATLAPGVWAWRAGEVMSASRWLASGVGFVVTCVVPVPR